MKITEHFSTVYIAQNCIAEGANKTPFFESGIAVIIKM
ncbi:hypothetical protein HJ01_03269 [Flavobacterium frigoris PS1]|uniref:Uncharacterized protein n=1 Tax=Flavobacterium frigoris (strain PS1) TaxID=1086011 RepID=H7FVP3_FLAFP|nr:hypothetical protein HJ01_03269 [Flavobacterium frigoris PS1]